MVGVLLWFLLLLVVVLLLLLETTAASTISATSSSALPATTVAAVAEPLPVWKNHSAPVLERVSDLVSLLTLEEKASLLSAGSAAVPRLGLPAYDWARECERGDASGPTGTAYPTPLALAAAFDVELVYEVAALTALEVRGNVNAAAAATAAAPSVASVAAEGVPVHDLNNDAASTTFGASCFGPVSNLIRDSRWGRTAEMITGEDPLLGRVLSRAFTWGMQTPPLLDTSGNSSDGNGDAGYRMLITIAKHLNTYAGPEGWGFTFGFVLSLCLSRLPLVRFMLY